ncbi:MAG: DnaJ domain-containing protein [Alphaproteobacteria bacterium]|nr:DnaJ domain-containing protein [Alphaproteobacteria bacterium]
MIYFVVGVGALLALFVLARAFVTTDPVRLNRFVTWFLGALAMLGTGAALVLLLLSERLLPAVVAAGALSPIAIRLWRQWRAHSPYSGTRRRQSSHVESEMIAMTLDHVTGEMSGVVKRGAYVGRSLARLSESEILDLLRLCQASDADGTRLLEAYLDRAMPDWRQKAASGAAPRGTTGDSMTRDEAYAILGLASGASETQIRDAHRRLMKKLHPDQGGSNYLAAKLNRAKEVLLGD